MRWLATGSLPGAAMCWRWIYFAEPDIHVLAGIIRQVLAFALVVSALCVAAYPLLKRYAMAAHDPAELVAVRPGRRWCSGWCSACSWR